LKVPDYKSAFTIESYDPQKNIDDSMNSLEFVCLAIGKAFNLDIFEIMSLLTDRQRGLAHLIVQGTNQFEFQGVIKLYRLITEYSETLRELMEIDKEVVWVMNSIRCGLFSNSIEVAMACINLMKELNVECTWRKVYPVPKK
jgi:hypothetical protein